MIVMLGLLLMTQNNFSQPEGSDWKDNETCLRNLSLYYEFYNQKNYHDAIGPWRIVFRECPDSKESLYAYGVNMYRAFAENENDPAVVAALVDTMMMIYDQRLKYFPDNEGDVLGRKGIDLLRFMRQAGEEYIREGYDILSKSIEIEKDKSSAAVVTTQISAGISLFLNGSLEGEKLINNYVTATDILDAQLKKRPNNRRITEAMEAIDQNIKDSRVMTCESIVNIFGPQFESKKDDPAYLDLVAGFLNDAGDCDKTPFFAKVAERRYSLNPTASAAYDLGVLFQNKSEYLKSKDYFLKAVELSTNNEDKANYYYRLAFLSQSYLNSPNDAAKYAIEAINFKPDWGDPYILLGMAYVGGNSALGDEFERRTAYWVAVDMFTRAKDVDPSVSDKASKLISDYTVYFPTKEDLFFRSITEGDPYKVGGWIQRTTTARPKK